MELAIFLILFFGGLLLSHGLFLFANFLYDVWKNRKRDYVGEIRRGELAIENDDAVITIDCVTFIWPEGIPPTGLSKYYHRSDFYNDWISVDDTTLPTIKASELIKHLNK